MNPSEEKHLVQYILVRSDLQKRYSHALKTTVASSSTSAIHSYSTAKATKNIDSRNSLHSIGSRLFSDRALKHMSSLNVS